jgi:hypothetical protein
MAWKFDLNLSISNSSNASKCAKSNTGVDKMPASSLAGSLPQNTVGTATVVIESILLLLVFLSIGLRLWSRKLLQMRLQANDYLILVAAVCFLFVKSRFHCKH